MDVQTVIAELQSLANPRNVEGMGRFGINVERALGISVVALRPIARRLGKNHAMAEALWASGIHEARHLAYMVEAPLSVTEEQLERWAPDFDSWDIVDGICGTLIGKTRFVFQKADEWSSRPEEFVKRAGFVLMVQRAVHDKRAADDVFVPFFSAIEREAWDERRFVWKAVNWALRQIGKRNLALNKLAIETGERVHAQGTKSARWIASDALRELRSEAVHMRLAAKEPG